MTEEEIRIEQLEKRFERFSILAGPEIDVSGSIGQGFAVNLRRGGGGGASSEPTGACCVGEGCSILSAADCAAAGGVYQGNGSSCAPNPCVTPTGACCIDGVCSILTEGDCNSAGGSYQGDDTPCDPDPCPLGACCDGADCFETDEDTCTDDGRIFKGIGTTCADPDICPTGACCDSGSCYIDSQFNCESFGGTYQGDASVCSPNPCPTACCPGDGGACSEVPAVDCTGTSIFGTCGAIVCGCTDPSACNYDSSATNDDGSCAYPPSVSLGCDISFASGSKCGFFVPGSPPRYYLQRSTIDTYFAAGDQGGGHFCHGDEDARFDLLGSGSVSFLTTENFDITTCTSSGSGCTSNGGTLSLHRSQTGAHAPVCDDEYPGCTDYSFSPSCPNGGWTLVGGGATILTGSPCGPFTVTGPSSSSVLANEYTTAMLIAKVEGDLPGFPGVFDAGSCAASTFLSTDEATYSEQNAQYKFFFGSSATPFQVCWVERFTPDGGGSSDTPHCDSFSAGTTESGVYSLPHPGSNGTTVITDITITCL